MQALKTLGEENVTKIVVHKLVNDFTVKELNLAFKEAKYSTSWIYRIIKQLAEEKKALNA